MWYVQPMTKPTPKPISGDDLLALARGVIAADRFPYLSTVDGDQPRVRPVSPVRTDAFTVYVANLRGYHKTGEIAANPKVELCYMDAGHNQVRLTGELEEFDGIGQRPGDRLVDERRLAGLHDRLELLQVRPAVHAL